jgi:hypothetical protein
MWIELLGAIAGLCMKVVISSSSASVKHRKLNSMSCASQEGVVLDKKTKNEAHLADNVVVQLID